MTEERGAWSNKLFFLFTCIGYATGLGNLWRFPALAYENGGGGFLIPYIISSFLIGFPMLYLELSIGQFTRRGPSKCFHYFMPVLQGIGWAAVLVAYFVGVYYNMINVYSAIYMRKVVMGQSYQWMTCRNEWNSPYCESKIENERCGDESGGNLTFYHNGSCWDEVYKMERRTMRKAKKCLPPVSPAEEFFENYIHERSSAFDDFGGWNWQLLIGFFLVWIITALTLAKGVNVIGKISSVTATLPFVIITAIFIRAVTLDGAEIGFDFFFAHPDYGYLLKPSTWVKAAVQICYTLGIGFGGLLSLSSYNQPVHNCYRDGLIVVGFDSFMSVFGGSAAFCTMGFMAKQTGLQLDEVLQSGTTLAFVAYPQAMYYMPLADVWCFLFFLMFFFLGISSQFGMTECMVSGLCDQFTSLRRYQTFVVMGVCTTSFLLGLPLCTKAGIYWFNLFNEYAGTFALFAIAFFELITISYIYGIEEYRLDLWNMIGKPTNAFSRIFGGTGTLVIYNFKYLAPVVLAVLFGFSLRDYFGYQMTYGSGLRLYTFPYWANYIGWTLAVVPLFAIPLFAIINLVRYSKKGNMHKALEVHPKLPSHARVMTSSSSGFIGRFLPNQRVRDSKSKGDMETEF